MPRSDSTFSDPVRVELSTTEVAKVVRGLLRKQWPSVRFSVRSDKYAGGSSVHVRWTDGPMPASVDALVNPYQGCDMDGMQDMKVYRDDLLVSRADGSLALLDCRVDFIQTSREISQEWRDEIAVEITSVTGMPCDFSRQGSGWNTLFPACVLRHYDGGDGRGGEIVRYAGTEYGSTLMHQAASQRERFA